MLRKAMDNFWGKLVKWHDGIGRPTLDCPNHRILKIWVIHLRKKESVLRSPKAAPKWQELLNWFSVFYGARVTGLGSELNIDGIPWFWLFK